MKHDAKDGDLGATWLERIALRCCDWAERWIPDAYVFAVSAVVVVAAAAMLMGASPQATATSFATGFWSLIPFTMQMCFIIIGGYVVATSPPIARAIDHLAAMPRTGRGAILLVALIGISVALIH